MKSRGLLIAALILAALSGFMYWSNRHQPTSMDEGGAKLKEVETPKILAFNAADITQLSIRHKDEPPLDLSRNSTGAWQITAPKSLAADQDSVSSLLSSLSSVTADRVVDEKPSDLAPFGLATPSVELDAALKDKQTKKLLIGDQTPAGSSYYAMLAGDPRLFTIASYTKTNLDKSSSDLRDKRLLTADFDKVTQIALLNQKSPAKPEITFARDKDAWQILKPKPARADSSNVEDLIRSLKDAKLDAANSDEAKDSAAFKSASPFATVKLAGASGAQQLEIRRAADKTKAAKNDAKKSDKSDASRAAAQTGDYYAKSSVVPGVYKIPATVASALDKSLDDFRNKKLFDFGYSDPDKIEIHDAAKAYFLTRSSSDWWGPDGKKLDPATVQPLLDALRDLTASKFPDSGFSTPTISIVVTSGAGKNTEKVLVAKSGDGYIAKRESEPALYELSASSVTTLQKSAESLKPAPPPPPAKK